MLEFKRMQIRDLPVDGTINVTEALCLGYFYMNVATMIKLKRWTESLLGTHFGKK